MTYIVDLLFQVYALLLLTRVLGSWIQGADQHKLMQFVAFYTDPYLNLFRKWIPPLGMIDISPMIAFISLEILKSFILGILR